MLPIQMAIQAREATADQVVTTVEAQQMLTTVFGSVMGAMIIAFGLVMFNRVVKSNPGVRRLANPDYEEPVTPRQARYIAILCMQLKITTPYEEQVRTFGEAGRMIRELEAEREHRKRLKGGNPVVPLLSRAEFEDLPTAYRGFDPGKPELKVIHVTPDENIAKYHGRYMMVGRVLPGKLMPDPEMEGFEARRLTGIESFNLGSARIPREYYLPPSYELYLRGVKDSNPEPVQNGTCYEDAWRFLIKQDEGYLVHGSVRLYEGGREVKHAWVELPTSWVWEPQTKGYFTLKDFGITSPIEEHRYTSEEAAIMVARTGNHGPWSDEERMEHIGR